MDDFNLTLLVILAVVFVITYRSIRIVNENERLAVFMLGRFFRFKGPGLVLVTDMMSLVRLSVGDIGVVTGPEFVRFSESDVPVGQAGEFTIGDSVRILSFNDDGGPFLTRSNEAAVHRCPECGHEF